MFLGCSEIKRPLTPSMLFMLFTASPGKRSMLNRISDLTQCSTLYLSRWSRPGSSCPTSHTEGWSGCRPWWQNTGNWSECSDPAGQRSDDGECPRCWLNKKKQTKAYVLKIHRCAQKYETYSAIQQTLCCLYCISAIFRAHTLMHLHWSFSAKKICERIHKTSRRLSLYGLHIFRESLRAWVMSERAQSSQNMYTTPVRTDTGNSSRLSDQA